MSMDELFKRSPRISKNKNPDLHALKQISFAFHLFYTTKMLRLITHNVNMRMKDL